MAESPEGWIFHVDKSNCASFEATTLRICSHHKIALGFIPRQRQSRLTSLLIFENLAAGVSCFQNVCS